MKRKDKKKRNNNKTKPAKHNARPRYVPTYEKKKGTIDGTANGYAFFLPDDGSGDLFIPAKALNGAIHGDVVEVVKTSQRKGNGEGEVVRVVSRARTTVVGVFDGKYLVPDERHYPVMRVEKGGEVAFPGDKVVAKLVLGKGRLKCKIVENLGDCDSLSTSIMSVIRSYELPEVFPRAVLKEAQAIENEVVEADKRGRRDFRNDIVVTIDGDDSKDFDDAICVKPLSGGYRLYVHIADVTHYVTGGSKLDSEALTRGTSVYFADRVIPMLPEALSNGICSLNEGVDRLTLSVTMDFNSEGEITHHEINEGIIRSSARLTYGKVQAALDGDEGVIANLNSDIYGMLLLASELAHKLNERRLARGAVEFDIPECYIELDGEKVVNVSKKQRLFSHKLIEEFMLIANETVAEHYVNKQVPFVYRVHEQPPEEKVENLNLFLAAFNLKLPDKPQPIDYANLLSSVDGSVSEVVSRVALRSMSKAEYRPQNLGHYGLAAQYYCHFTSPIRRYPDLAIHRIIKHILSGGNAKTFTDFVVDASTKSSSREKIAEEAERKVDDLLKAKFMEDKVGNTYSAAISGVTEWGIFAELDNGIEGRVRIEDLPGHGYEYDEARQSVTNGVTTYRLGDKLNIIVAGVSADKVAFELASK